MQHDHEFDPRFAAEGHDCANCVVPKTMDRGICAYFSNKSAFEKLNASLGTEEPTAAEEHSSSTAEEFLASITDSPFPPNLVETFKRIVSSPEGRNALFSKMFEVATAPDKKEYWRKELLEANTKTLALVEASAHACSILGVSESAAYHFNEASHHLIKAMMILRKTEE